MDEEGRMAKRVLIGIGVVVAFLVGVIVYRSVDGAGPVAEGRPTDACPARGSVGLVGLDRKTGAVRWTNVVGDDVQNLWTPGSDGDVTSGDSSHVWMVDSTGKVRRVVAETGAVDQCPKVTSMAKEDLGIPPTVDGTGATARARAAGSVEVIEADGSLRWRAEGRDLVGSSPGGVVVVERDEGPDCCDSNSPGMKIEVRDPAAGDVRWSKVLPGFSPTVSGDHLLVVGQLDGANQLPLPMGDHGPGRLTAYDLADGAEVWHVDRDGLAIDATADAGLVLFDARVDGQATMTAIDEATGEARWTTTLPTPGRGGDDTEVGGVLGVAVAGDVVAVAIGSVPPHRD